MLAFDHIGKGSRYTRATRRFLIAAAVSLASPAFAEAPKQAGDVSLSPAGAQPQSGGAEHAGHAGHAMRVPNGIVSLDVVSEGEKLHLLTGKRANGSTTLWHQVSADGGRNWSVERPLQGPPASVTRGSDARIVSVGGKLLAVWTSYAEGGPHGGVGPMAMARSTDGGKTWDQLASATDWPKGPHSFFTLASDGKMVHASWLDSREGPAPAPGAQGLRYAYSSDAGASWSKNATLDVASCACCWTTGKADNKGNFYVLYRDKQPSDMAIGVVEPKTHQWTRLSTVGAFNWDFAGCPHIGGGLALNEGKHPELHAVVGTRKKETAGFYHLSSVDGGRQWSEPVRLGDDTAAHGDIAIGTNHHLAAVWDMVDPETSDGTIGVFSAISNDGGLHWSQAKRVSGKKIMASHPRVVATKSGFLALWTEQSDSGEQRLMSRVFRNNADLAAQ
jgi:hypothetical protein